MIDKKQCNYGGTVFPHSTDICTVDKCLRCNDGEWQKMDASVCCWDSPFRGPFCI